MSARTISTELVGAFKRLRLGGLLPTLAERLTMAETHSTPLEDVLLMLLTDEISRRDSTAATRRAEQAGLDPDMLLERWDKTAKVSLDRRVLNELVSLRRGSPQRGDPGTGGRGEDIFGQRAGAPVLSRWIQRALPARRRTAACPQAKPNGQLARRAHDPARDGRRADHR